MVGNIGSSRNGYGKSLVRRGIICFIYVKMLIGIIAIIVLALLGRGRYGVL